MMDNTHEKSTYTLWDLPTRIFHWSFVALIILQWISGENELMTIHFYNGYTILALIIFRIFWGIFGSDTSNFMRLFYLPKVVLAYLIHLPSKEKSQWVGHNPIGGLSVILLLLIPLGLISLGLIGIDENYINEGPLSGLVSYETGTTALSYHEDVFHILVVFVIFHMAAILYYRLRKKENLIKAMITGKAECPTDPAKAKIVKSLNIKPLKLALLFMLFSAGLVYCIIYILPILT